MLLVNCISVLLVLSFFLFLLTDKNDLSVESRQYSIFLRGIAIMLIVVCHCMASFTRIFTPFGGIGVALFLILSGYGLNESFRRGGVKSYWKKRVKRVWIPYFLFISVVCIVRNSDTTKYLYEISLFEPSYWYLRYIFYCYLVFFLTSYVTNNKIRLFLIFIGGVFTTTFFKGVEGEQGFSFAAGVLISEKALFLSDKKMNSKVLTATCLLLGLSFLLFKQTTMYRNFEANNDVFLNVLAINVTQTFVKFPLAIALLFGLRYSRLANNSWVMFIGTISYELYLTHMVFLKIIEGNPVNMLIVVLSSILLAWILCILNSKVNQSIIK